jgi:hypothetical protein
MEVPALASFALVGGTALALRFGHRQSVDIDLFSPAFFENEALANALAVELPAFQYRSIANPLGLFGMYEHVKLDLVKYHRHPLLEPIEEVEGIRMFSMRDIMAMKVAAILRRAVKKDFYDLAALLQQFGVKACIEAYHEKFPTQQLAIAIPYALTYFADAEESEDPVSLNGQTWAQVKRQISQHVNDYLR